MKWFFCQNIEIRPFLPISLSDFTSLIWKTMERNSNHSPINGPKVAWHTTAPPVSIKWWLMVFLFGVMSNILPIIGIRSWTGALKWFKPHGSIFISKQVYLKLKASITRNTFLFIEENHFWLFETFVFVFGARKTLK